MKTHVLYPMGSTIQEGTREEQLETMRTRGVTDPEAVLAEQNSAFRIREEEYVFQPQRYVDTFGTGVYSPTTYFEVNHAKGERFVGKYPECETREEAIQYLRDHQIFGAVQRMYGMKTGTRITAGIVYTSPKAPISPMTAITSTPGTHPGGGTRWGAHNTEVFDALCELTEDDELIYL